MQVCAFALKNFPLGTSFSARESLSVNFSANFTLQSVEFKVYS